MVFLCCLGKPNVLEDVGQMPNDQDSKSHPEPATPPHAGCKFVFDENNEQIIGIDNSGRESESGFRISDALLTLACLDLQAASMPLINRFGSAPRRMRSGWKRQCKRKKRLESAHCRIERFTFV